MRERINRGQHPTLATTTTKWPKIYLYNNNNSEAEAKMSSYCSFGRFLGRSLHFIYVFYFGVSLVVYALNFVVRQKISLIPHLFQFPRRLRSFIFTSWTEHRISHLHTTHKFMSKDVNPTFAIYFLDGKWFFCDVLLVLLMLVAFSHSILHSFRPKCLQK